MTVTDKIVLITGASDGIGRALALEFAHAGSRVIALGRDAERLSKLTEENEAIITRQCDITNVNQIKDLFTWLKGKQYGLDVLINNAGVWQKVHDLTDIDDRVIAETIQTNLLGTIYCTKYALPLLRESQEAALVNIVSMSGVKAQVGQAVYTASKYGAKGFTDVLRADLQGEPIHVMAVYQAGTNTQMFVKTGEEFALEKFTEPKDLASLIVRCVGSPDKMWVPELHVNYR